MGKVQTSQIKVNKTTVKRKGNSDSKSSKKSKNTYCILCRSSHLKYDAQEHIHSMLHHRELEAMLGRDSSHECQACRASSMGLFQYAQHISTAQHKAKLKSLISKHVKPISLHKTLSKETIGRILERNKTLKKEEKKQWRKKRKKLKQIAGQNRAEMQHRALQKNLVASRVLKLELSKQANRRTLTPMQGTHQKGSDNAVVQNKEKKVSSLQRHLHQRETTLAGRTWQQACVPGQFNEPNHQMRCDDNFSANNQCISVEMQHSKTGRCVKRPNSTQEGVATDMTEQISWSAISQYDYYNRQDKGAIIIDEGQNECCGPSQPGQDGSYVSSNPASAHKSVSAAPIQDVDVNSRLRQIRRALGVREPYRADREARRQNSEAGVRLTDLSTIQQSGAETERPSGASTSSVQSLLVSTPASAAHSGVCLSNIAPAKERHTTFKMTQESAQHWEKRSVVADGLSNSKGKTTSTEPHLNKGHKVRIAHKPGKIHRGKEVGLKPTLNKLRTLSGAKSKLSWMEMYNEMKSNGQDKVKGMPRFGIELANSPTNRSTQPQDSDLPLSQGFHWESIPDSPSEPHSTSSPPPWDTMGTDSHREVQADSKMQEPSTARQGGRGHSPTPASVKVELNFEDENGGLRDNSSASKRKHNTDDTISNKEPSEKKKRPKSSKDQDQMPQLLAVSLREDELSHSLQDLDKSLVQARNALHAAYTEVQRLLLLRQQFTAEVNNLRAKRIEILQGMQEGYSGASNEAEKAATSLAGAAVGAAAVQPRHSPLPFPSAFSTFSIHQTPATASPSSIAQPHPAPLPLSASSEKLEICRQAGEGQGGQFLSSNPNAPYVPLNQPVPLFPSDHFPPLLLRPSNLAAPAAVATAASTSVNTLLSPESSSARQQERQTWEGRAETKRLAKEKAQPVESDSEEESGGNPVQEQVKGRQWAAEKPVPRRGQNAAVVDLDDGSESDDSVKMIEPSKLEVIDIDESDNEAAPETVSDVSVELISASTQTFQQNEDRKIRSSLPVRHSRTPKESVDDEEPSLGAFGNHSGPIHGLQVHEGLLYTCSADNTVRAYSLMNRECQAVFEGHTNKVNCLLVCSLPSMPTRLYTGSSDQSIRCYSIRSKKCLEQISLPDRVLCLHIAWNILYAGLANGSVASYDLRTLKQLDVFECHGPRGVSCLGTVQEGARRVLLVGSYDSTISVRDAKSGLLLRSLEGHTKTVLCMKVVNDLVFSSSSDTSVHAHNIHTGELLRIYKGHGHAVTSIVILGKVMVTACLDKLIRIYELQSHDRLQVYGGHSDMVMCMTVHRNVIYTGCYDGSVQAVKLNLRKNYRCWWQNCSLIFGIAEHLVQHLVGDHSNPKLHTVKCRWRGCYTFFATQQAVGQELPEHMRSHVDNDSKVEP